MKKIHGTHRAEYRTAVQQYVAMLMKSKPWMDKWGRVWLGR